MKKISVILGTRPEAIKLAPVILSLKANPDFDCRVCVTAQHRQMLDQVLEIFEISPDVDLNLMRSNQTLAGLTARAIEGIDSYLAADKPDAVLVQGDTTTVLAGALAAFYHKIPVGHVEAGLRTGNMSSPWPEEANRVLTTRLTRWHFTPTEKSRQNLLSEGVSDSSIFVTGNTVIDALLMALKKINKAPTAIKGLPGNSLNFLKKRRMVLITGHRRENFGEGFENICRAIADLADCFKDVVFIYPVHLNPNVLEPVERILRKKGAQNIYLLDPQTYLPFVALMNRAHVILTDSGGVQEEAPSLGKPVLVMRNTTERPEAVEAGVVKLIGTGYESIKNNIRGFLENETGWRKCINPYGDGKASQRIVQELANL